MPTERPLAGLLGRGAVWEGDLSFDGRVRLDGVFRGRLHTDDVLEVGEGGWVEGEVDAAVVRLAGTVEGRLHARRRLVIEPTGCAMGAVQATVLEVLPGGRLHGQVKIGEVPPRPEPRLLREPRSRPGVELVASPPVAAVAPPEPDPGGQTSSPEGETPP